PGGTPALTKIYPRGSHWAVGHLMGKKSSGDFPPDGFADENKPFFSTSPESVKRLEDYLRWEELSKHFLRLLERNENRSAHLGRGGSGRNAWEADDDNSSWKDMMDYLLQVVNMKESAPS
ncbi:gastrin-releasing peptide, partial [Empidonax traillii]|uniref:gastrin-releasing peptide n=1 Tax=Empidonax traillii TaxID=164674 RepID=UPI000FFD14E8